MTVNNAIYDAIRDTVKEIEDILAKSGSLAKADDEEMPEQAPAEEAAPEMAPPAPEAAPQEQSPEQEMSEAPAEEAAEGEHSETAELEEQAKQLSDEELEQMLEALLAERESRMSQHEGASPEAPAPEAAPQEPAMKSEMAQLGKSMTDIMGAITSLSKEVEALKAAPAPKKTILSKPPVSSRKEVEVLEKSIAPKKKERLSKSETMTFLENEIRRRNKSVSSMDIAEVNLVSSEKELSEVQDRLTLQGIQFPEKN